jgi:hypothetical protein
MTLSAHMDKDEMLRALETLPPEAVAEVREFIEYQKYKAHARTEADALAIRGWLRGHHLDEKTIDQARREMWARLPREATIRSPR